MAEDIGIVEDTRLFQRSYWDELGKGLQEEPFYRCDEKYFERDTFLHGNDGIKLYGRIENLDDFAKEKWLADLAQLAVEKYNEYNDEPYLLVGVENVNGYCCAGFMLYIAMKVQKATNDSSASDDSSASVDSSESYDSCDGGEIADETFHAVVYRGIGENAVLLVRPKLQKKTCL